jgi:hypothetical protein
MDMEIAAWVASVLVFTTFFMKTMAPLRLIAIASNVAFIAYALLGLRYGIFGKILPIFVLHLLLLPLNVMRLCEMKKRTTGSGEGARAPRIAAPVPHALPRSDLRARCYRRVGQRRSLSFRHSENAVFRGWSSDSTQ